MLSIKGREPFIRMQLWLNDPTSIDKLQAVRRGVKDGSGSESGNRRKRSYPGGPGSGIGDSGSDRSSPVAPEGTSGDPYTSADSPGSNSAKKQRVYFSDEQKEALKIAFALDPYPSASSMEFLSQELGLETRSISNWFHNHRMRLKQQLPQGMDNLTQLLTPKPEGGQSPFDPVKFKLLLHQRMAEMQSPEEAAANSQSVTSLLRQFPNFLSSNPGSPLHPGMGAGLDLSYKRDDEDDKDSIAESAKSMDQNEEDQGSEPVPTPTLMTNTSSSRSRRKPAAPQWVRPEWNKVPDNSAEGSNGGQILTPGGIKADPSSADGEPINGVCVMNAAYAAFGKDNAEIKAESGMPNSDSEDKK